MSFKIVKTIEKGKPELCVVPSQWESGGVLKWPKRGAERLSKDQDAIPRPDWLEMKCSVKRRNIISFEVADAELRAMLDNTDTEKEDEQVTWRRPVQHREPVNYNVLADQLVLQELHEGYGKASEHQYIILPENAEVQVPTAEPNSELALLFDVTNKILETQKKIINKLASLSVQIDESFSLCTDRLATVCDIVPLKDASRAESDSFILKQIKNVKELEEMEQLLSNNEYKNKLKSSCSFICSGGNGSGTNCAYRFLDILFSRDFLFQCSWSGGSRDDSMKVSLKCYKNTLIFFFQMVNHWDNSYTYEDNDIFFKNILKNAKKRSTVKYERIPTKRHRTTGKNSAKKQKTNDASNVNENIEPEIIEVMSVPFFDDQLANDTNEGAENMERVCHAEEEAEEEESLC